MLCLNCIWYETKYINQFTLNKLHSLVIFSVIRLFMVYCQCSLPHTIFIAILMYTICRKQNKCLYRENPYYLL